MITVAETFEAAKSYLAEHEGVDYVIYELDNEIEWNYHTAVVPFPIVIPVSSREKMIDLLTVYSQHKVRAYYVMRDGAKPPTW